MAVHGRGAVLNANTTKPTGKPSPCRHTRRAGAPDVFSPDPRQLAPMWHLEALGQYRANISVCNRMGRRVRQVFWALPDPAAPTSPTPIPYARRMYVELTMTIELTACAVPRGWSAACRGRQPL